MESNFYILNAEKIKVQLKEILPKLIQIYNEKGNSYLVEYCYAYIEHIRKQTKIDEKTTCSKNKCSFCCHSEIKISIHEFEYIKKQIKSTGIKPDKKRSKLQNSKKPSELKWVEKACPFLTSTDGKGECSIYDIRPILCRNHTSTSPVEKCDTSTEQKIVQELRILEGEVIQIALNFILTDEIKLIPIHKIF